MAFVRCSKKHPSTEAGKLNPAREFINALISDEENAFSPKHLAEFAVEVLSDPYLKIEDLSIMLSYILTLIADRATWPGQRERIRRYFAEAVGLIPKLKFNYRLQEGLGDSTSLRRRAVRESEGLARECLKLNDDAFVAAAMRHLERHLQSILSPRRK